MELLSLSAIACSFFWNILHVKCKDTLVASIIIANTRMYPNSMEQHGAVWLFVVKLHVLCYVPLACFMRPIEFGIILTGKTINGS